MKRITLLTMLTVVGFSLILIGIGCEKKVDSSTQPFEPGKVEKDEKTKMTLPPPPIGKKDNP
jgi:hypothetical protein